MKVWDRPVRLLHWALVLLLMAAWFTSQRFTRWHDAAGYGALALVLLRVLWGFIGSRHARFTSFVRAPAHTARYAGLLLRDRAPRYIGHNPLGAWMVLALLACIAGLSLSGWLFTTDRFWGDATVQAVHLGLAWALLVLVALHLAGVAFTAWRHHENLVAAMFSGRKRPPGADDVAH